MGLFDGPVMSFAEKFCKHLDSRVEVHHEVAQKTSNNWEKMRAILIGDTLNEISVALKSVAGIE